MSRVFLILFLFIGGAAAQAQQEQVKAHFTAELRTALRSMLEAQIAKHPDHPRTQQLRQNLEQEVESMIPRALAAFSPELTASEADAIALLRTGPDDTKNKEEIHKNRKLMDQSALPKPAIVTLMLTQMDSEKRISGWRLETLRRLTQGTVRQLKERGELK